VEILQKSNLAKKVCEQLIAYIEKHELQPGDRLPSQKSLMNLLQISSASLREGLKYAEALGIIYTKHGSGSYVKESSIDDLLFFPHENEALLPFMLLSDKEWYDLLEMRLILEIAAVRLGVNEIKGRLPELNKQIGLMEASGHDLEAFAEADIGFHQIIIESVGNRILENVYSNLQDLIRRCQLTILQAPNEYRRSIAGHKQIYQELVKGDLLGAQEAMAKHLRWASEIHQRSRQARE
jgi:GntR family transcriptional repressor for pyruvate dehydrogenase complex